MNAEAIEVADVLRGYGRHYLDTYPCGLAQARIIDDLTACRTATLGGHLRQCTECGHQLIAYNSCRNRHCPKCQGQKQAGWMAAQSKNLLDVPYFHIVFTLPQPLGPLSLQNKRLLYGLLMRRAADTLLRIARDTRHLGAAIGFTAILHTWGQTLMHHPHVHCRTRRWTLPGWETLGWCPSGILPAGTGALPGVSRGLPGRIAEAL